LSAGFETPPSTSDSREHFVPEVLTALDRSLYNHLVVQPMSYANDAL